MEINSFLKYRFDGLDAFISKDINFERNINVGDYIYVKPNNHNYWFFGQIIGIDKETNERILYRYKILDGDGDICAKGDVDMFYKYSSHYESLKIYKSIEDYIIDIKI